MASASSAVGKLPPVAAVSHQMNLLDIGENHMYSHPETIKIWSDDMQQWPSITGPDIVYYLVNSKACDLQEMKNYRSLESYNYLQSGWVGKVLCHNISADSCYIKAAVCPSQSVNAAPRNAWACVKHTGQIVTAGCSCMAGNGKACSHVGALLWKVEMAVSCGLTGSSCTDKAAQWNCGTKRNVEPAVLEQIDFKLKQETIDGSPRKRPRARFVPMTEEEIKKMHEEPPYAGLFTLPGTILYETLHAPERQQTSLPVSVRTTAHGRHTDNSCTQCRLFYNKHVVLSSLAARTLELETVSQDTPLWHFARKLRLTASNISKVPKKESTSCEKAASRMLKPTFMGNAATKHGKKMEPVALKQFVTKAQLHVKKTGTVINTAFPWLSASPDGLIETENAIIEIKCPYVLDCMPLINGGKYDVRRDKEGKLCLAENGPNGYYSQVQVQMLCTKTERCFFYIWSAQNDVTVLVPFDSEYIESHFPRLKKFYFSELLPRLRLRCSRKVRCS